MSVPLLQKLLSKMALVILSGFTLAALFNAPVQNLAPVALAVDCSTNSTGNPDVFSGSKCAACTGISFGSTDACQANANSNGIGSIISTVIDILSIIVGVSAVIVIVIAGFRFVLSGGGNDAASARNSLIYAIVGLIVVGAAQIIVHFVLHNL